MTRLPGYEIFQCLYESSRTIVYQGKRKADDLPVVLKILNKDYPAPKELAQFRREFELIQNLDLDGVIKAYGLEPYHNSLAMVLEDIGGGPLSEKLPILSLRQFFSLAIRVANILGQIHQSNIIHKDIKPSSIIWNSETGEVRFIDFGLATALTRENPEVAALDQLEGTLPYMSPEQTGRMNRNIDYRTDLYSLGTTFYHLLIGRLPFKTNDPLEWVHFHIAKTPVPLHLADSRIPPVLSGIVMKLMAKNAEDRYQSAYGLKMDLEKCLRRWSDGGQIDDFPLGEEDVSEKFQIPQKLYGREKEKEALMKAFDRVSCGGTEMLLVTGYAGIGKSSLVHEIHKPIVEKRGYFISGKFDQFKRNSPYVSLIQAFRELALQILAESGDRIDIWKQKLLKALGSNGQMMTQVIPELELIIGPQPSLPKLNPVEAQNRFNRVFQNLVKSFAAKEHPLVIFLDDLQWADSSSLKLIEMLMTDPENRYIFLIGAYRDNEVNAGHPLLKTVDDIQKINARVSSITLKPLEFKHINQIVAETLKCGIEEGKPLADLCQEKTRGNPFFLNQFLCSLYEERSIVFDGSRHAWSWDVDSIRKAGVTDNVVDLMAGKIRKLSKSTQRVLQLGACIGGQFDLNTLSIINEKSSQETANELWEAMSEGLISPTNDQYRLIQYLQHARVSYRFIHDRVQQAAYSLIDPSKKDEVHFAIGRLLLDGTVENELEKNIFEITDHLNFGKELVSDREEKIRLAGLNLQAGRKARESAAYEPAFEYLRVGLGLIEEQDWEDHYDLALALHVEAAEAAYLNVEFDHMEQLADVVMRKAATLLDKVKVYQIKIQAYIVQNKMTDAVNTGLEALKSLGIKIPQKPNKIHVLIGFLRTKLALAGKSNEQLNALPEMSDPARRAAMNIITSVGPAAFRTSSKLLSLLIFKQIILSIKYGNSPESAFAYATYGALLCKEYDDIPSGCRLGELAFALAETHNEKYQRARVHQMINAFIRHWKEHVGESLKPLLEDYHIGLEAGDLEYAAWQMEVYLWHLYFLGRELPMVDEKMKTYVGVFRRLKNETVLNHILTVRQAVLNLMGKSENPCRLTGDAINEDEMMSVHMQMKDHHAVFNLNLHKLILCYLFGDYPMAVKNGMAAEKNLDGTLSMIIWPTFYFYYSLSLIAVFPNVSGYEQKRFLKKIASYQKKMRSWADHAPMNFLHKYYLVEAEKLRILNQDEKAREHYDSAIAGARENGYLNEEALAYELAGKFFQSRKNDHTARHYLKDAHYTYSLWGALAKVRDLERVFPEYLSSVERSASASRSTLQTFSSKESASTFLDLPSVLKASHAMSSEMDLGKLLETLMRIVLENAAAQRGCLVLLEKDKILVEAEGSVESGTPQVMLSLPFDERHDGRLLVPAEIVQYVIHTKESLVIDNANEEGRFYDTQYIRENRPQSVFCTPLIHKGTVIGAIYLENNLASATFHMDRIEMVRLIGTQAAISITNAREILERKLSEEKLKESRKQLRDLVNRLQSVREEERIRISREVHDELGQMLTVLSMDVSHLESLVSDDPKEALEKTKSMSSFIDQTIDTVKRIASDLRPGILDQLGLVEAIKWFAEEFNERAGGKGWKFDFVLEEVALGADLSTGLFRIYQEALTNIARHADASEIHVKLFRNGKYITFKIEDNGKGMAEGLTSGSKSLGLIGMRERALAWKGELRISGTPGKGTVVTVKVPYSKDSDVVPED